MKVGKDLNNALIVTGFYLGGVLVIMFIFGYLFPIKAGSEIMWIWQWLPH